MKLLKNWVMPIVMALFVSFLVACDSEKPSGQTFTVNWNVNGVVVETDSDVSEDTRPDYNGQTPTKESDDYYTYAFVGWSTQDNQETGMQESTLPKVTSNITYYAAFSKESVKYTITWKNADGSTLGTTQVAYGQTPSKNLPADTDDWDYTGWSPSLVPVTGTATYTAVRVAIGYTISNEVLVDNEDLKIMIVGADKGGLFGFHLDVYYENKTADKELMFSLQDVVINGYVINSLWVDSIEAGTTATDEIWLSSSQMEQSGIATAEKIELSIRVYDYDDWSADDYLNQKFTIYPTGLSDEEVVSPERPTGELDFVLVDDEEVTFVVFDTEDDPIWGYSLLVYIENKTSDKELMFSLEDLVVNGYGVNPLWATSLPAGTKTVTSISPSSSQMELSGITSVDEVELYIRVYDDNDWLAEDLINAKYTIYPTGLSETEIISPERPSSPDEFVVVDNEDVAFIIVETYIDSIWGYTIKVYMENKTSDKELRFDWEDVLVNGYAMDPYWAATLMPGSKAIGTIEFSESDFEENNIVTVESVEFFLEVVDDNDWDADPIAEGAFEYISAAE